MITIKCLYEKHPGSHNSSRVFLLFVLIYYLFAAIAAYSQVDGKCVHIVQQINGEYEPISLPAEIKWISEPWYRALDDENAQMPYLAYMPEKDRVVMMVVTHHPTYTALIFSDDHGKTWSKRRWLSTDFEGSPKPGIALGLTNLGGGMLLAYPANVTQGRWLSSDYGGLSVSISKDKGKTWSELSPLYEWGRHHPSMVLMANGDIVMTYVVRLGYPATHEGFPQFGVEAVVSHDNGQTWDKKHRYILSTWVGNITGATAWFCSVQPTSTVLLPDGMLLTAFGTGFRNSPGAKVCKMDVEMVRWRLNPQDSNK